MSEKCIYVTKTGRTCRLNQKVNGYCNKHKNTIKAKEGYDLSKDEVFGNPDKKEPEVKKEKVSYSNFKITINSQKDITKMSKEQKETFKKFIDFIFHDDNLELFLIDVSNKDGVFNDNIIDITKDYYFEVGDEQHRLHTHAQLNLKHKGYYKFNISAIREMAKKILGYSLHINVQASSDPVAAWNNYIKKKSTANVIELD